ncbi:beta-lactamase family protein [Flavobacteriaceae bacterium F08102]|nr:beta-lactamase family protein [Flavobacteriaceae bacterium F08102]
MIRKYFLLILLFFSSLTWCQKGYHYSKPKQVNDGWHTKSLNLAGYDTSLVAKLFNQLATGKHKLHSVLAVYKNSLMLEEYLNDQRPEELHDMRSATKSVIAILVGIAIDQGLIKSVEDVISLYLKKPIPKKNIDPRKDRIRIKDLLTMSSGLDCNDWDQKSVGQEDKVYRKKDWLQFTLDLPMLHEPGEVSAYCTMGVVLLAEILQQVSGKSLDEFANTYLFEPLGIVDVKWGHTNSEEVITAGKRLYMTPRDMAKIGQLVLNRGKNNKTQLVSAVWIDTMLTKHTAISTIDYGYLWWNLPFKFNNKQVLTWAAMGNGGQYIMVFKELDLVIVSTGGAYNSADDQLAFAIAQDVLLPTFMRKN